MKAAAYARYSTDKQTENSIEYQLQEIRKYCDVNGIEIVATYTDEGPASRRWCGQRRPTRLTP